MKTKQMRWNSRRFYAQCTLLHEHTSNVFNNTCCLENLLSHEHSISPMNRIIILKGLYRL